MKSLDDVKTFYRKATVDTNPGMDRAVLTDALKAGGMQTEKRAAHVEPRIWRLIMKNSRTKLGAAAVVVLLVTAGLFLFNRSATPVYGMTEALELMARARTMHIQGWFLHEDRSSGERVKLPFELWYDFRNGRYREEVAFRHDDETTTTLTVCDGQYVMNESVYKPVGKAWRDVVNFERVDPNNNRDATMLDSYKQLRQVEGFGKGDEEIIDGERYDVWQGEFDSGSGGDVHRVRFQVWLSPSTGNVGRTRRWRERDGQWVLAYERTLIERDVPLSDDLFVTEPSPGVEIRTSKAEATIPERRNPLTWDIYENTKFNYAPLSYRVRIVFALKGGSLLACWQAVDNTESRDQSKYFADLQVGGDLPKLPVEVTALSPEPNVRDVLFVGFHLAHTEEEIERGRRWYEWSLYVPDGEPPEPNAVMNYRIHYRINVERTDQIEIQWKQTATPDPTMIESEEDFETHVFKAMAERSDNGAIPAHVTYDNVMRMAEQLRASVAQ